MNPNLKVGKTFSYSKSLVSGIAANPIGVFSSTENNYAADMSLLRERFGMHNMLVHSHLNNLVNIEFLKASSETCV